MSSPTIDPGFLALPFERLADAALARAAELGAGYADFRFERKRSQTGSARDGDLESFVDNDTVGFSVRVIHEGAWGFASGSELTTDAAASTAARAVAMARTLAPLNVEPVELADEPAHQATWISSYEVDPFDVGDDEKVGFLLSLDATLRRSGTVDRTSAEVRCTKEQKFLASLNGARITQQRIRVYADFTAVRIDPQTGSFETMGPAAPPAGRGWEYFTGGWDFTGDAEAMPALLDEKMRAPSIEPGRYDLVIHPTNLWLTIHESVAHATELDRALGYEANYAGTTFATPDKLNALQYGSKAMNVTGDRIVEHGLATTGYDDEGVASQRWSIIEDGVLVGYQLNRQMALKQGFGRSNGCAFADSPHHVPLQRMPNVSLAPADEDVTLDDLIGGVDDGIYIVGDKSWSIDMQRSNFQFTGQRFFRIKNGRLAGQVKDVAYQAKTTDFWNALDAVGGPSTYVLGGTFGCGKGQPGQSASVSHGCPAALFRNVNVLNTAAEGAS